MSEVDEQGTEESTETEGSRLRRELEAARKERDQFLALVQASTIERAGFDPAAGVVKRLAQDYKGEWTPDAFREYAVAEGLPAPAEQQQAAPPPAQVQNLTPDEQTRLAATERVGQVVQASQPDDTPSLGEQISEAEQQGRWDEAASLKGVWTERIRKGVPNPLDLP